jgi:hypothetical protein
MAKPNEKLTCQDTLAVDLNCILNFESEINSYEVTIDE